MQIYEFKNGFPWLAVDDHTGYRIRDCMVFRMRDEEEVAGWDYWNYQEAAPEGFPEQWARQFWSDLDAAPHFVTSESQWSTYAYSLLSDHVIFWTDDRQQSACYLQSCVEKSVFLLDRFAPQEVKEFVRCATVTSTRT